MVVWSVPPLMAEATSYRQSDGLAVGAHSRVRVQLPEKSGRILWFVVFLGWMFTRFIKQLITGVTPS